MGTHGARMPEFEQIATIIPTICIPNFAVGKRQRERWSAYSVSHKPALKALEFVQIFINGVAARALVDTGCVRTIIARRFASQVGEGRGVLVGVNGSSIQYRGNSATRLKVGSTERTMECVVMDRLVDDIDAILGMDVIRGWGGVAIGENGVRFGIEETVCAVGRKANGEKLSMEVNTVAIEDTDFSAHIEEGTWTVSWKWKDGRIPRDGVKRREYMVSSERREGFDAEISDWVKDGILVEHDPRVHEQIRNYVPLMAVEQQKGDRTKIRPVFDFRELNKMLENHPGGSIPICKDRLKEWRQMGVPGSILDLKRAYLQIKIEPALWCWQGVIWKGKDYLLTRLGFGIASAPKIMTKIVEHCLIKIPDIKCSSYIDDIFVNGDRKEAERVSKHLAAKGLASKPSNEIGVKETVRVLGLKVNADLNWERDSPLPEIKQEIISKRQLHQLVGELLGHFPRAGWLRVACGYLQRKTAEGKKDWAEPISDQVMYCVKDLLRRIEVNGDPVRGKWCVEKRPRMKVWADASTIAMGVALEVGGSIIEDAAWLRKKEDSSHINMSELDAVLKGINMAVKWNPSQIEIVTDSATVYGWLKSAIEKSHNVHCKAMGELLIKRRLQTFKEVLEVIDVEVKATLVPSRKNKADALTRVPATWLRKDVTNLALTVNEELSIKEKIKETHEKAHMGVARTLEMAKCRWGNDVNRKMVRQVIAECERCSIFDPHAQNSTKTGKLAAPRVWQRLAADVTHVNHQPYLTVIDTKSRFAIWQPLSSESGNCVAVCLHKLFAWVGPPEELLSDNGTAFRSAEVREVLQRWSVGQRFSCAYRPQGNGIAERSHRTIKRITARANCGVEEAVFWYNVAKSVGNLSPYEKFFRAKARRPGVDEMREWLEDEKIETFSEESEAEVQNPFKVGDEVFLRPPAGKCNQKWSGPHQISKIKSPFAVELNSDGITRHVNHLKKAQMTVTTSSDEDEDLAAEEERSEEESSRPQRIRKRVDRYGVIEW